MQKYYDQKVDIWGVGVLLYIMLSGFHPFEGSNFIEILNKTIQSKLEFPQTNWKKISD